MSGILRWLSSLSLACSALMFVAGVATSLPQARAEQPLSTECPDCNGVACYNVCAIYKGNLVWCCGGGCDVVGVCYCNCI